MNAPLRDYGRLGLVHFMAYPQCARGEGPVVETVRQIADDGDFEVIEIARVRDVRVREETVAIARQAGLTLTYCAQPAVLARRLDPNSLDEVVRQTAVDALRAEIDEACAMGAAGFAFLSGPDPGEASRAAASEALVRSIRALCDHAAAQGTMPVVLETFDRTIDKKALVGPNAEAAEIARDVGRSDFGLLIDLSHLPLQGETPRQAAEAVREHLRHAHVGNCVLRDRTSPAYGDLHPRFGYPGGENDVPELAEYLRALLDIGYLSPDRRPVLGIEVKPQAGETSDDVIQASKAALAEAWARV